MNGEGKLNWIMGDSGPAVTSGIRGFLGPDVPHGTCGQHFIAKNLPELKKWMPAQGQAELYATVREFMEGLRMFPPPIFFNFWTVIKRHFVTDLQLEQFTDSLDGLYFKKSSGWMASRFALNLPTSTNACEGSHAHLKTKLIRGKSTTYY